MFYHSNLHQSDGVPVVRLPDRKDLLAYLKGESNSAPNIDRAAPVDISLRRPVSKRQHQDSYHGSRRGIYNCSTNISDCCRFFIYNPFDIISVLKPTINLLAPHTLALNCHTPKWIEFTFAVKQIDA